MRQRASFQARRWTWRSLCTLGRALQLAIMGFTLFVGVNVVAEMMHKPIIADRVQHQHIMPAAHAK